MKKRMFRSLIHLTLAVCLLTALLCGCRGVESCPAAPEQTADTSLFLTEPGSWDGDVPQDIIELIETAGHRVTRTATAPGILHGQRYHMELDDDKLHAVSVYKYENAEDAAAEAACIGTDGYSFTFPQENGEASVTEISWVDAPHFYLDGRYIILYIGQDTELTAAFADAFGPAFAGIDTAESA